MDYFHDLTIRNILIGILIFENKITKLIFLEYQLKKNMKIV